MPPEEYTRGERLVIAVTNSLPSWLLGQPERVLINFACFLIGLSALIPPPDNNLLSHWPVAGRVIWGGIMIAGSIISVYGSVKLHRAADRLGALSLMSASFFMSFVLFSSVGLRAFLTGTIFLAVAFAKLLRFLRATAVGIRIRHHLAEERVRKEKERGR